jgi:hypothetical protein
MIVNALASLRAMLEADGYQLALGEEGPDVLVAEIRPGPSACAECLVPKDMMRSYFEGALREVLAFGLPEIRLIYPSDS